MLSPMGSIATGSIPAVQRGPDDLVSPQLLAMLKAKKNLTESHLNPPIVRTNWQEWEDRK